MPFKQMKSAQMRNAEGSSDGEKSKDAPKQGGNTVSESFSNNDLKDGDDFFKSTGSKIDKIYNSLISDGGIIDISSDYPWSLNHLVPTQDQLDYDGRIGPVPFVYAIEYKQRYGVTATNLMNDIYAIKLNASYIGDQLTGVGDQLGVTDAVSQTAAAAYKVGQTGGEVLSSLYNKVKGGITGLFNSVGLQSVNQFAGNVSSGIYGMMKNTTTNMENLKTQFDDNLAATTEDKERSQLLYPYAYMYSLEQTGSRYCFPFLTENAASLNLDNDFGSDGQSGLLTSGLTDAVHDVAAGSLKLVADIQDISKAIKAGNASQSSKFVMYNIEKAKAFSFPTTGRRMIVRFPLFNTTKKDAWKNNYKFIILFALRNMLFRRDNVTYYPPLIYDVNSPGWGRMPLSYVKQFSAKPVGMIRPLGYVISDLGLDVDRKNDKNTQTTVNVPEAWIIEIQFQSLIADSANQYLSSIFDLPIYTKYYDSTTNY